MQKGNFEKNERVPLPKNQIMPVGKFDGDTTYDRNYVYNQAKRETAIRPEQQLKVGGKFEGNSSYANDYLNKGLQ